MQHRIQQPPPVGAQPNTSNTDEEVARVNKVQPHRGLAALVGRGCVSLNKMHDHRAIVRGLLKRAEKI